MQYLCEFGLSVILRFPTLSLHSGCLNRMSQATQLSEVKAKGNAMKSNYQVIEDDTVSNYSVDSNLGKVDKPPVDKWNLAYL